MKITVHLDLEMAPVSFRSAWLIAGPEVRRGCRPSRPQFQPEGSMPPPSQSRPVHRVGTNEQFANLQRLLAGIRLTDQQIVELHAQPLGPRGSSACSASDEAATPPSRCVLAITCSVSVFCRWIPGRKSRSPATRNARSAEGDVEAQASRGDASIGWMLFPSSFITRPCRTVFRSAARPAECRIASGIARGLGWNGT